MFVLLDRNKNNQALHLAGFLEVLRRTGPVKILLKHIEILSRYSVKVLIAPSLMQSA
jgi:hypothetical protein